MKKSLGIASLLVVVSLLAWWHEPNFFGAYNVQNIARWTALFGIISIGAAFVIITGGIDLSIGSVVGLVGSLLPWLLDRGWPAAAALAVVLLGSLALGWLHGVLVTRLRLQSFVVTLCGMLIYRGVARWVTADQTQGFGEHNSSLLALARANLPIPVLGGSIPAPVLVLLALAILAAVFLNKTVPGRHLFALGRSEEAARYSGIATARLTIVAYAICAFLSGVGGVLFALDFGSIQPSAHGNFYEVYAIAAAVLGGCSLRGGEGSVLGVVLGAALMRVLYNAINVVGIPTQLEFAIIGAVILIGVIGDETIRRLALRRLASGQNAAPA